MNVSRGNPISAFRLGMALALSGIVLAGCSKKVEEKTETPNSQIVARVGNDVITSQELDNEFRLARVPVEKRKDPALIKQVLGEVVTRKYMARKALDAKLDREPTVLLDLLRARDIVLANAAASRDMTEKSSAISKADVDSFIAKNPLKFADRQIVSTEQIAIPANTVSQELMDSVRDMKSLEEVDQKLTAMGIAHARSSGALNSADVSADFFNLIKEKRTDNVFFLRGEPNAVFFKVNSIDNRPVEGDDAIKAARHDLQLDLLRSEASLAAVEANLATKYEGEYANIMKAQAPAVSPK
jgi:EpsD family peptidyl-prolyl cis-trans isomerase